MKSKRKTVWMAVALVLVAIILSWLGERWRQLQEVENKTGLDLPRHKTYGYVDTHGGFFGDGHTLATLRFSEKADKKLREQMEQLLYWNEMPLTENVDTFLYGGYVDGWYVSGWSLEGSFPKVTEGYWFFVDEFSNVTGTGDRPGEAHSDAQLLKRGSYNVTVVLYDTVARTMYYFELDT